MSHFTSRNHTFMSHFVREIHTFMSHFVREIHTFMSHFATVKAANLFQSIPSAERKRLVLLEEGTPKPHPRTSAA